MDINRHSGAQFSCLENNNDTAAMIVGLTFLAQTRSPAYQPNKLKNCLARSATSGRQAANAHESGLSYRGFFLSESQLSGRDVASVFMLAPK